MICELLALAEISHELSEMDTGETFSLFCDVNSSRCCDLKFEVWDAVLGHRALNKPYPDYIIDMGWAIRYLADKLERHFAKRTTQRAGKGL